MFVFLASPCKNRAKEPKVKIVRQSKWYIQIDGKKEGPYSYNQLRDHPFVTPFTLAKKKMAIKGKKGQWRMMGQIAELKSLFQATESTKRPNERKRGQFADVLVNSLGAHTTSLLIWSILALLLILFIMFTYSGHR